MGAAVTHLLTVLQHALFGSYAALGSGRVGFPAAGLNVDVHVELSTEHGHLRFSHRKARPGVGSQRLQGDKKEEERKRAESLLIPAKTADSSYSLPRVT